MWISYSDSEVNTFHPVCEEALSLALKKTGKDSSYQVVHHQYTGSLEMDFVIQNKRTKKYLCVIEVKRTPADVHSARYQYQAMSYVQMNASETEKPFYILTNLEYAFSFRYDSTRSRVFQQMLAPGLYAIGDFSRDSKDVFIEKLASFFATQIQSILGNRYEYLVTLEQFAEHMERIKNNPRKWKSGLAFLLYEYIRGAFTFLNRNELRDVRLFRNDVEKICREAAHVNFKEIFNYSDEKYEPSVNIDNSILSKLFDFGNQNVSGDSVAGILHQIVSTGHEHEGEVPTDLELGRFVAELAHYTSGDLSITDNICDPAAGSGNLISSALETYNIEAKQVVVNDVNPKLLELLSLRIGLNYARTINKDNSPSISCKNIAELDRDYFNDVKVLVLNPPFLAGIYSTEKKPSLYHKIRTLSGKTPVTQVGQMPLEAVFIELLSFFVVPGTTIACVFPKTHLLARGLEAQIIRSLLINNLGLRTVFTYPGNAIFDDVTKDTFVLVGKAMQKSEYVEVISSYDNIPDIDLHKFGEAIRLDFAEEFTSIMPGVVAKKISTSKLLEEVSDGWRELNSEMTDAIDFVNQYIKSSDKIDILENLDCKMKRGSAGNNGGSDLLFFDSRQDLYESFAGGSIILKAGLRNAKLDSFVANDGDSKFFDVSANDENLADRILEAFINLPARGGVQARNTKSKEDWKKICERESRGKFEPNVVLIPRAIRTLGRVYYCKNEIFVSTNFVVLSQLSERDAILLSTWMSTIFYQLVCETSAKDQEGMRKMEIGDILKTYIPCLNAVSEETYEKLRNCMNMISFLELKDPEIREVDRIWAEEIFGAECVDIIEDSRRLLGYFATRRNT